MNPTNDVTILIGAPLEGDEARFLRKLHADLADTEALILANFEAKPRQPGVHRQIDFVVVTKAQAALIELKTFARPIFGHVNGDWRYLDFAGNCVEHPGSGANPYRQALEQKYALSDEMARYRASNPTVPPAQGGTFYRDFVGFVCVYPVIHVDSQVTSGDHKIQVKSYQDVLAEIRRGSLNSKWRPTDWRLFAERHLRLAEASLDAATDPRIQQAHQRVSAYCRRVENTIGLGLPPLIGGSGQNEYGAQLVASASEPRHHLLIGPSGSAKTFHLHHLALALCRSGHEVPLLVEAKNYRGGAFWTVLRLGTAPFAAGDPKALLESIRLSGLRPVLLIDALNECSDGHVRELVRGAQAFALEFGARLVLTSQSAVDLPADLTPVTKRLPLPDPAQKRLIYFHHAGLPAASESDAFWTGFTNAYDLRIAGLCHGSAMAPDSRSALYDRYVRRCLPEHTAVGTALLRELASEMGEALSTAWSRNAFERGAERFLSDHKAPLAVLDVLRQSRLLTLTDDFVSFEHELLCDYFKAEDLQRRAADIDTLAIKLQRPRNRDLVEFVLPRLSDDKQIAHLLSTIDDVALLSRAYAGHCGARIQLVLMEQCSHLMDAASQDLPNITVECETVRTEDGRRRLAGIQVLGTRSWTSYEAALCDVIALNLHDSRIQARFLELLDLTEWTLRSAVDAAAGETGFRAAPLWAEAVRLYGGCLQHGTLRIPCSQILSCLRSGHMYPPRHPLDSTLRDALLERTKRAPAGHFALFALLQDRPKEDDAPNITENLALVQQAWESGAYILQVDALELLQSMNRAIHDSSPEKLTDIRDMLEHFETDNIMVNTVRFETMAAFDALQLDISVGDALTEMRALIAPGAADDPQLIELAAMSQVSAAECLSGMAGGCLGKIFEDIFQGIYFDAYSQLELGEKRALLCLSLKEGEVGFLSGWTLQELLREDAPDTLPVYERCASGIEPNTPASQEAVTLFVLGIEGCARWSDSPPAYRSGGSPEHQAWQVVGEILFWLSRGAQAPDGQERIAALWSRFEGPARLAVGDVLYHLSHSQWRFSESHRPQFNLVASFSKELRPLLEECLAQRDSLTSVFQYGGSRDRGLIRFLIATLGKIGDSTTTQVLRGMADDAEFGRDAIQAIEEIQRTMATNTGSERA